jgi:nondiscriminating aspartyl-tRNA synthetase
VNKQAGAFPLQKAKLDAARKRRHQPGWHRGQPLLVPVTRRGNFVLGVLFLFAERVFCDQLAAQMGREVQVAGWLQRSRQVGRQLAFWVLRDRSGWVQVVLTGALAKADPPLESVILVRGTVVSSRSAQGYEVQATAVEVLTEAPGELPFEVNQPQVKAGLDLQLDHRVLSLRHPEVQAVFHVKAVICQAFRDFLAERRFTEVQTPKIVATGTEGGAELFPLQYFEQPAFLAQSPQFYKQMLVAAGLERVFEVAPAFRAEEHNTSRHTNEFISLDLEMGFVTDENELMDLENQLLLFVLDRVRERCQPQLAALGVRLPRLNNVPRVTLAEAQQLLLSRYGHPSPEGNLDPQGERLLCQHTLEKWGVPAMFVTRYPKAVRPFYALTCPDAPDLTCSFDLLLNGMEVTTGGLRIHRLPELLAAMRERGLNPEGYEFYLEAFRLAAPPHGGFAIGLERLTARLLGLENVRQATLFPRDRTRLVP